MRDRVYVSTLYLALIVGSSWAVINVGEALTREALTHLALLPAEAPPSRVDTVLAAQQQPAPLPNARKPLVPAAPSVPLGTLAKAMDEAEQPGSNATDDETGETPEATTPRVAGWSRRLPKRDVTAEETTGHIILRTLRAGM